ncbi:hypothetical protein Ga0080574_TMP4078 [Salipiger abyssi]|uniref:Uncharacterized protein n=1 Tax=Salipiger abyssi TaxID=1250539 RepID=A0A1P8UYE4_9RHOB|nr:hypothetical protein Ga0080574_TMP4078 [Salipiger abyssi]
MSRGGAAAPLLARCRAPRGGCGGVDRGGGRAERSELR